MKVVLPSNQPLTSLPREFREMGSLQGLIIDFLREAFEKGITIAENISHNLYDGPLLSGVTTTLKHSLNTPPSAAMVVSGRVEFCSVISASATSVTVKASLLTTTATADRLNIMTRKLETTDATFFQEGDPVKVDGAVNVIVAVRGDTLVLKNPLVGKATHSVALGSETVKLLLM